MKKFTILGMVAVLVLCAGMLTAAAVKFDLKPWGIIFPGSSGHAILNYAQGAGTTEVQVNCWGLPEDTYTIYLETAGFTSIGTFTTKKNGSGNFHIKLVGDHTLGVVAVAVNNSVGTVLYSK